jgi:CBS domain containing-hemolysin-like protein
MQQRRLPSSARLAATTAALLFAGSARASFFAGEALDTAADYIALFVIFVVPIAVVAIFWFVHILPEKVAEAREHPQKEVINVICLLSLVFGGLLWPIAWIMAYSKPVIYKMAYGRDKHDDYYAALEEKDAAILGDDVARLRTELDSLAQRGQLPVELRELHARLTAVQGEVGATRARASTDASTNASAAASAGKGAG